MNKDVDINHTELDNVILRFRLSTHMQLIKYNVNVLIDRKFRHGSAVLLYNSMCHVSTWYVI